MRLGNITAGPTCSNIDGVLLSTGVHERPKNGSRVDLEAYIVS